MLDNGAFRKNRKVRVALMSGDATFAETVLTAFGVDARFELVIVSNWLHKDRAESEIVGAEVVIVDLELSELDELSRLQTFLNKREQNPHVIAVLREFDQATARALLQMRIADLFVKPGASSDLVRACIRLAQGAGGGDKTESKIYTFLPVLGGVGTTTLAIQAAMTLLNSGARTGLSTCLIDLNTNHGTCLDYLDLEPRLDLAEIEPNPGRLDRQLLEGMVSPHPSGLSVIAAANRPAEMPRVDPNTVMILLNMASQCFDQIIIDMPKTWQNWTDNILLGSTKLYLVGDMSVPGVRHAKQLADAIVSRLGHGPQPKVVINRFERQLFGSGLQHKDFVQALGDAFAGTIPADRWLVREAIDLGVTLEEVCKGNKVSAAVKKLMSPRPPKKNKFLLPFFTPGGATYASIPANGI